MAASSARQLRRFVPLIDNGRRRAGMGLLLSFGVIGWTFDWTWEVRSVAGGVLFVLAWMISALLTDKYRHKYPYRYDSYVVASHSKAAVVMSVPWAVGLWALPWLSPADTRLWISLGAFCVLDLVLSLPRRRSPIDPFDPHVLMSRSVSGQAELDLETAVSPSVGVGSAVCAIGDVARDLPVTVLERLRMAVPRYTDSLETVVVNDRSMFEAETAPTSVARILVLSTPLNDIRRINRYILAHAPTLVMGGFLVARYEPLESVRDRLRARWKLLFGVAFAGNFAVHRVLPKVPGLNKLYFAATRGWGRNLSRAEVWGRLSFCGFRVVAEVELGEQRAVIAHRVALPIENRRPSYYPLVGLTKIGLDGQLLQTHKVRSMYPFSEFLQKQIFEDNGLVGTGKFKNDFRLTEYGKFLRRHWIDELPQLYDWLRGDIKLVGIRATSPHFLSLYPADFIESYIRVKPGLVPPLFAEGTDGFDQIVEIERAYLERYARAPLATDVRLLWDTFVDIVFRGVRSK
ncbi:MAG: sugar transferase [Gemmatimonadaceae bacterium]|nr:sugar transferase [Gemmatimonadaceae bacterium]